MYGLAQVRTEAVVGRVGTARIASACPPILEHLRTAWWRIGFAANRAVVPILRTQVFQLEQHPLADIGVGRVVVLALQFMRVLLQIEQLPFAFVVVIDQFESVGAHAVVPTDAVRPGYS